MPFNVHSNRQGVEPLSFFIVLYAGIVHALEADHVLAVTNIVTQRKAIRPAVKDGIYWGLGHTSTILLVGGAILVFKAAISDQIFSCFEAIVGLMLILIAVSRLIKFYRSYKSPHEDGRHLHAIDTHQGHVHTFSDDRKLNKVSYGIGLVHGLAGSGALVAVATTQLTNAASGMVYLLLYGLGSVLGMALVSGFFSIPFSRKLINSKALRSALVLLSSVICILYGAQVIYANLT